MTSSLSCYRCGQRYEAGCGCADGITLIHGDCRDVLPMLAPGSVDLVLTDPPYGVKASLNSKTAKRQPWSISGSRRKNDYGVIDDSPEYVRSVVVPAFKQALAICERAIVTPGNRCVAMYPDPDSFGAFFQPASEGLQRWGRCDAQPILYYGAYPHESRRIPGQQCSYTLTESPPKLSHPCPKPIGAWRKLLSAGSRVGETVLDPFAGSGTTGRACKDLGRKCVMVELEEKYCAIAARRLAQEVLPFAS